MRVSSRNRLRHRRKHQATPTDHANFNEFLVRNYNQTNNPGYFRVIRAVGSAFVISGQTRQGNEAQRKAILDTVIQPRSEKQVASMMLQNLVFQCGSKSGVSIELGLTPLNMLNQVKINGYTSSVSCRTELTEILSKLPSAFTYQLLYDINSHSYVLNVLPAHQVVVGSDGKTTLVPLKQ